MKLSPGLLDEEAVAYLWETHISNEKKNELLQKEYGEAGTNERIRIRLTPVHHMKERLDQINDAKTEATHYRAKRFLKQRAQVKNNNNGYDKKDHIVSDDDVLLQRKYNTRSSTRT
jgi:hypothetical protein